MATVLVYDLGGTWVSAPTFTFSALVPTETLEYDETNGVTDNQLDDMFISSGAGNQQGTTSDTSDASSQTILQTTLFGINVSGYNVSAGTMFTFNGSDGSTIYMTHILTNDGTAQTGPISSSAGYWVSSDVLIAGVTYTPQGGFNSDGGIVTAPVCFTSGTLIKTQTGERAIEDLTKGDMVLTMDNGYQPIRWVGSSTRRAVGDLAPILIRKGALGNDRDLRVSPQHRMLLQGWQAELLFGETEVLATAKSLINDHSIIRVEGGEVEYFHMLFDTHEIVWAEGSPSESFHPGEQGWKGLDQATRDEILTLFPQLADGDFTNYGPSARISLKHKEGQVLGEHMIATPQTTH